MSDFTLNVVLDDASILAAARMANFETLLYPNLTIAMGESLDDIEFHAQEWMYGHFMNPLGPLEEAFTKHVYGGYSAELWNDLPYAQRRNYGFSGMYDSLGRFYPYDPGIAWAENAVANSYYDVDLNFKVAVDKTIAGI